MMPLSWINDLALPLALVLLLTDWLTLWLRWIVRLTASETSPADPALSPVLVASLVLSSIVVTRLALGSLRLVAAQPAERTRRDPGPRARRIVTVGGLVAVGLALWLTYGARFPLDYARGFLDWSHSLPAEVVTLVACVYLWWRGIAVGQSQIAYDEFERAFYGGVLAFAFLLGLDWWVKVLAPGEAFWAVLLYFAVGLSALALLSFERARRQQQEAGGAVPGFNRYWLGTVMSVIGLILAGGLAAANLVAPQSLARVFGYVELVVSAVALVLVVLLGGIAYAVFWIIRPLAPIIFGILINLANLLHLPTPTAEAEAQMAQFQAFVEAVLNSPVVRFSTRGMAILIIGGSIAIIFWAALRRFRLMPPKEVDETRESILSGGLLLAQLRSLLSRLRPARPAPPPPDYLSLAGLPDDPRTIIRRAYQRLLEWARRRGVPRAAGQTPRHYADFVTRAIPESQDAVMRLTRAYVTARYDTTVPTQAEVQDAQRALEQLLAIAEPKAEEK